MLTTKRTTTKTMTMTMSLRRGRRVSAIYLGLSPWFAAIMLLILNAMHDLSFFHGCPTLTKAGPFLFAVLRGFPLMLYAHWIDPFQPYAVAINTSPDVFFHG